MEAYKTTKRSCFILILLFFLNISLGACQAIYKKGKTLKTFTVSGKVTQTFPYCGGAAPSKELLEKLAKPVAYAGKKFFIREGKTNSINAKILESFSTGKDGEFSIRLAPGIYSIILEEQLKLIKAEDLTKEFIEVDEKCLEEWWSKPYYLLEVKNYDINDLNFNFFHRCFILNDIPCINYNGPQPM